MKRYTRNSKQNTTMLILVGVGALLGVYFLTRKSSAAALPGSPATPQVTQAQYDQVKAQVVSAQQQDGVAAPDAGQVDIMTQAYIRGDRTEVIGILNALRGIAQTNTAGLFATRLDQLP